MASYDKCDHRRGVRVYHGHSKGGKRSPTFQVWTQMMERCYRKNCPSYKRCGAKGIKVCERWKSFVNFLEDMGVRPPGKTLFRKKKNGHYSPGNCRWATRVEQAQNRRSTVNLTLVGITHCVKEWSKLVGLPYTKVWQRLDRGWTPDEALEIIPKVR